MFDMLLAIAVILIFVGVIYMIERRVKTRGALFIGQATPGMRVLALVLGILFAGLFVLELTSPGTIHIWFPILAVALLSYGLGVGRLLGRLQRGTSGKGNITESLPHPSASEGTASETLKQEETTRFPTNRLLRFVITLVIVLVVLALALYGAVWAATHPNDPFALVYVVGFIVLFALASVFEWFKFLGALISGLVSVLLGKDGGQNRPFMVGWIAEVFATIVIALVISPRSYRTFEAFCFLLGIAFVPGGLIGGFGGLIGARLAKDSTLAIQIATAAFLGALGGLSSDGSVSWPCCIRWSMDRERAQVMVRVAVAHRPTSSRSSDVGKVEGHRWIGTPNLHEDELARSSHSKCTIDRTQ